MAPAFDAGALHEHSGFAIQHAHPFTKVTIACGLSGHGFKFASGIGEILADLARPENASPDGFLVATLRSGG